MFNVVYLLIPTSNHNYLFSLFSALRVVYLLIPTSNHNLGVLQVDLSLLYIFWFLHQTTTPTKYDVICKQLYIFWFLHQTTTSYTTNLLIILLYIFWFLHQTTTSFVCNASIMRCISFDSYIKPQPSLRYTMMMRVVYLLIPTSNHNSFPPQKYHLQLYIFWFLHQTTTWGWNHSRQRCCISFDSYIKPQLHTVLGRSLNVVYLLIPTSNHNSILFLFLIF